MTTADYVEAARGVAARPHPRHERGAWRPHRRARFRGVLDSTARAFFGKTPATFDALASASEDRVHPRKNKRAMAYAIRTRLPLVQVPDHPRRGAFPPQLLLHWPTRWIRHAGPGRTRCRQMRWCAAICPPSDRRAWPTRRSGPGWPDFATRSRDLRPDLVTFKDAGNRELFDLPDAPRPGRRYAGGAALSSGVRQPRAVARRSHAHHRRRAPRPASCSRICRSVRRSSSMASSPAPGRYRTGEAERGAGH